MTLRLNSLISPFLLLLLSAVSVNCHGASYDGFRWFQIEVSIFSNDYPEYRNAELWTAERLNLGYPERAMEFKQLADILVLEDFAQPMPGNLPVPPQPGIISQQDTDPVELAVGPFPRVPASGLRLPDQEREAFLLLPPSQSDFQTTNTRLQNSPVNRLLFHGLWRQPVVQARQARPLIIRGGRQYGQHHELEGTLTIRFNANEDRVVIDTNLWLTEFASGTAEDQSWELPPPPGTANSASGSFSIQRIVQMQQSRAMRSTEFHYLDHPALGLVIRVLPYDLPPPVSLQGPTSIEAAADEPGQ